MLRVKGEVAALLALHDGAFTAEETAAAHIQLQRGFSGSVKDLMRQLQDAAWGQAATMHGDDLDERLSDEKVVAWLAKAQEQAEQLRQVEEKGKRRQEEAQRRMRMKRRRMREVEMASQRRNSRKQRRRRPGSPEAPTADCWRLPEARAAVSQLTIAACCLFSALLLFSWREKKCSV